MATYSALGSRCIYAKESTKNTRETPDHHMNGFRGHSFQLNQAHIPSEALTGSLTEPGFAVGNANPRGTLRGELTPESMGEFWECAFGQVSSGAGPPYAHTCTPASPLPTMSVQAVTIDSSDGTERAVDLVGAMVASWGISWNSTGDGAMVLWEAELAARQLLTDQSPVAASIPSPTHLTSVHTSLTLAAGAYPVESGSLRGDNGVVSTTPAQSTGAGLPDLDDAGRRVYSGSMLADFTDFTEHDYIAAGTTAALVLTIESSSSAKYVITNNVRFTGDTPTIDGPGITKQPLNFTCTGSSPISFVLTNSDSAA